MSLRTRQESKLSLNHTSHNAAQLCICVFPNPRSRRRNTLQQRVNLVLQASWNGMRLPQVCSVAISRTIPIDCIQAIIVIPAPLHFTNFFHFIGQPV